MQSSFIWFWNEQRAYERVTLITGSGSRFSGTGNSGSQFGRTSGSSSSNTARQSATNRINELRNRLTGSGTGTSSSATGIRRPSTFSKVKSKAIPFLKKPSTQKMIKKGDMIKWLLLSHCFWGYVLLSRQRALKGQWWMNCSKLSTLIGKYVLIFRRKISDAKVQRWQTRKPHVHEPLLLWRIQQRL